MKLESEEDYEKITELAEETIDFLGLRTVLNMSAVVK